MIIGTTARRMARELNRIDPKYTVLFTEDGLATGYMLTDNPGKIYTSYAAGVGATGLELGSTPAPALGQSALYELEGRAGLPKAERATYVEMQKLVDYAVWFR